MAIVLNDGYLLEGDAGTASKIDYTVSGLDGTTLTMLASGQLADAKATLYTASGVDTIAGITLFNTHTSAMAVNLYVNDGTSRQIVGIDSLGAGYHATYDGKTLAIYDENGSLQIETTALSHKDNHDPEDGSDPLDSANAASIAGVQAAGTGTGHSFARDDHVHGIAHSIADNALVTIDDASVVTGRYARFTASGLESKTAQQVLVEILAEQLPDNTAIIIDPALSADGHYCGIVEAGTAGTALAFGDLAYLAVADSKWEKAIATAAATAFGHLGMVVVAGAEDAAIRLLLLGKIRADAKFPTLTVGAPVYISKDTAGLITMTIPPKATNHVVRIIGKPKTAKELWFSGGVDNTYLEYA